ncbi:hypothetical protein QOZ80_2AG0104750 [Eleusine coracana subsp. coracana]|nr:hypothetical protein QOZ80_2AG0104750 [Eleusine coracana subsp. coracana]
MGLKLSCINRGSLSRQASLTAVPVRIITADGSLKEFPASPLAAVTNALGLRSGDAAAAPSSVFVCNSDALYFNESPPALAPGDLLQPGQIYFVLPAAMLGRPLSSTEMAELAVRASAALAANSNNARRRCGRRCGRNGGKKQKVRVMPVREDQENGGDDMFFNQKLNEHTLGEFGLTMSPARSGEKKVSAARSRLRRALSIIREDAE